MGQIHMLSPPQCLENIPLSPDDSDVTEMERSAKLLTLCYKKILRKINRERSEPKKIMWDFSHF